MEVKSNPLMSLPFLFHFSLVLNLQGVFSFLLATNNFSCGHMYESLEPLEENQD